MCYRVVEQEHIQVSVGIVIEECGLCAEARKVQSIICRLFFVMRNTFCINPRTYQQLVASLLPGKQLLYSEGKSVIRDSQDLYTLTSWINNSLIFEDQPLQEVANYLQGWYGVSISLNPELAKSKHRYTFKVKTESLREVLNMISVVTPIAYKIEGEKVTITYK